MDHKLLGNFIQFTKNNYHRNNLTVEEICSSISYPKSYLHEMLVYDFGFTKISNEQKTK